MFSSKFFYPLHVAVKQKDVETVEVLLWARAESPEYAMHAAVYPLGGPLGGPLGAAFAAALRDADRAAVPAAQPPDGGALGAHRGAAGRVPELPGPATLVD